MIDWIWYDEGSDVAYQKLIEFLKNRKIPEHLSSICGTWYYWELNDQFQEKENVKKINTESEI